MQKVIEEHKSHGYHFQLSDSIVFITWRIAFTLPQHIENIFIELQQEKSDTKLNNLKLNSVFYYNKFIEFDESLGKLQANVNLNTQEISTLIKHTLKFYDNSLYILHSYCIMSNHLHIVIEPLTDQAGDYFKVSKIVQLIKGYTAKEICKLIGVSPPFWESSYFDRIIRNADDYYNVIHYVLNNPVKAGIVHDMKEWKDNYYYKDFF